MAKIESATGMKTTIETVPTLMLQLDGAINKAHGLKLVYSYVRSQDQMIHWIKQRNNALELGKSLADANWPGDKVKQIIKILGLKPSYENMIWQGYTLPPDKRKAQ